MDKMTPESLRNAIHQVAGQARAPFTPRHLMQEETADPADDLCEVTQTTIAKIMESVADEARRISSISAKRGRRDVLFEVGKIVSMLGDAAQNLGDQGSAADFRQIASHLSEKFGRIR